MTTRTNFRARDARISFAAQSSTASERDTLGPCQSIAAFGFGNAVREPPHPTLSPYPSPRKGALQWDAHRADSAGGEGTRQACRSYPNIA